ncbi:Response regulator receiver protein [Verrucomicrobia bacterium]|nr:Response regulator receiver protein [Verrucomicrobiota bacterium]
MKKILIVEDDQIVANIYRNKFSVEGFQVELAPDGQAGLEMVRSFHPDAVILDLMLPKMTGVELMKKIRAEEECKQLPVIVFSNTYLTNMVQEAWKAGASKCLSKANCTPKQVIEVLRGLLSPNGAANGAGAYSSAPAQPPPGRISKAALAQFSPAADAQFQADLSQTFLETLPASLASMRSLLQGICKAGSEELRLSQAQDLYRRIHALAANAGMTGLSRIGRLADALEALVKELHEKPKHINASTLRTVASAIDSLASLGAGPEQRNATLPHILVVDDEAISRRAIAYALEKAKLKSTTVEDARSALQLLTEQDFDLIFLDVDMPGMNGFELCTKLRALPTHQKTPVVFVTGLSDFESRTSSMMSGGNDLIAKPFLFMELAVKALVYLLRGPQEPPR